MFLEIIHHLNNLDVSTAVTRSLKRTERRCNGGISIGAGGALDEIEQMQSQSGISGVPSGYAQVDKYTLGWQKSNLIILGARPSVGKTALSLNFLRNAALDNNMPVAIFSLEMSAIELVKRLMTTESGLEADKIKGGEKLTREDWDHLDYSLKALAQAPIYIDDTPTQ